MDGSDRLQLARVFQLMVSCCWRMNVPYRHQCQAARVDKAAVVAAAAAAAAALGTAPHARLGKLGESLSSLMVDFDKGTASAVLTFLSKPTQHHTHC